MATLCGSIFYYVNCFVFFIGSLQRLPKLRGEASRGFTWEGRETQGGGKDQENMATKICQTWVPIISSA